jgi:lipopolysaccharide export system protein LptC
VRLSSAASLVYTDAVYATWTLHATAAATASDQVLLLYEDVCSIMYSLVAPCTTAHCTTATATATAAAAATIVAADRTVTTAAAATAL